jgi:hypothetical protein
MVSKRVKEVVYNILLIDVVRLISNLITHFDQELHETAMKQIPLMTVWCTSISVAINLEQVGQRG